MAFIIETPNPFQPFKDVKKHEHPGGISIRGWLEEEYPGFVEFPLPTVCVLNGKSMVRREWDHRIEETDVVCFISFPSDPFTIIAIIIVVAVVALTIVTLQTSTDPVTPGETPASDPVFSTSGQNNTVRLGEPIEVCYGRNRIYPSLAGRPAFEYIDNDQFQKAIYCIGQGEYEIIAIQIGDTSINSYQEVQYEVITPGNSVTLFPTNVVTSVEAGGHTLFAPNEPEYVAPGWQGPFPANPPTTETTTIAIDLIYPKGLYYQDSNGQMQSIATVIQIEYRLIDDIGTPLGAFTSLPTDPSANFTAQTTTPQRRTITADVAPGRYEIRMRRTDTKIISFRAGNDVVWEGLRAWIDDEPDFGNLTLLAVKIRATNNLNNQTETKFNVIATRKLPIRDEEGVWSEPVATRSLIWAYVDVMRNNYGGRIDDDVFFAWDDLLALDALYTSRGDYFDWIFRDAITVWEAAQSIAIVGRAVPLLVGSLLTMKRDGPLEIPVAMFTPENMIGGTFEWNVALWDRDEFDSVTVEYTDPTTGYLQETVTAALPGGTTDHPDTVRLSGCQDRTHAYREALFMIAKKRYLRESFTFDTGMEGMIPNYGDLIVISHDVGRWGQNGYVLQAVGESGSETFHLFLSEPLRWEETGEHQILLRGSKGEVIGPVTVTKTTADNQVIVTVPLESGGESIDFLTGGTKEPMIFLFGPVGNITKYLKIVKIEPKGGEAVSITAVNDAPIIHTFDELTPPPLNQVTYPPDVPDLPVIEHLYLSQIGFGGEILQAAWSAAFGAQKYIVQTSIDGEHWADRATITRTSIQLQADMGLIYVRVAGINNGQGPWISDSIALSVLIDVVEPFVGTEFEIEWSQVSSADQYRIKVYDNMATFPVLKRTVSQTARDFVHTYANAVSDGNVNRDILVTVEALDNAIVLAIGQIDLQNPIPEAPQALDYQLVDDTGGDAVYRISWELPADSDLLEVRLWLESFSGWDPAITASVQTLGPGDTDTYVSIPLDTDGSHSDYYFRVGVFDVWGNERTTNISGEQTLSQPT